MDYSCTAAWNRAACRRFELWPSRHARVVHELAAEYGVPARVSLEEHMGCGIGVCLGCVTRIDRGVPSRAHLPRRAGVREHAGDVVSGESVNMAVEILGLHFKNPVARHRAPRVRPEFAPTWT